MAYGWRGGGWGSFPLPMKFKRGILLVFFRKITNFSVLGMGFSGDFGENVH